MTVVDESSGREPEPGPPPGVRTMAWVRWGLVVAMALIALGSILGYFRAGPRPSGGPAAVQLYHCPMHPAIVRDHAGQCPICGMTLVPMVAAAPTTAQPHSVPGLATVDLSPERVQLIGMKTALVKREDIGGQLRTVGSVVANERGLAQITTRFAGWIETLPVAETGVHVRRGQVLATVYSPDVLRAQQELLVAQGWSESGRSGSEPESLTKSFGDNARRRLELLGISAQEIDQVVRTGKPVDAIAVRSPVDGYVVGKNAVVGLTIQPGTVLFDVADLSTVWVTADIYEADVARVRVGQPARFEAATYPGQVYPGRVQFIYPTLDSQTRTMRVRVELKNHADRSGRGPWLRPGMYGNLSLDLPATTGLMVPAEAVVDTGDQLYLFVAKPGGHFEPREVKVGARTAGRAEILSGVAEGERVVSSGNFLVDSESRLRAAIQGETR